MPAAIASAGDENCTGRSLMRMLPESGLIMPMLSGAVSQLPRPVNNDWLLHAGGQILDALDFMHSCSIAHCDVKPGNIFMRDDGTVVPNGTFFARLYMPVAGTASTRKITINR